MRRDVLERTANEGTRKAVLPGTSKNGRARAFSGVGAWGRSPDKSADPGGAGGVWVNGRVPFDNILD